MRILVVTQYFWPEEFRINDICKELKAKGHEVDVLTGLPNYPKGKYYDGYSFLKRGPKSYEGINIYRCGMLPRGNDSSLGLIFNYISFVTAGLVRIIPLLFKKYDRVFVFQVSPITTAIPAIFISKLKRIKSYIYVQDLWPETFYSIKNVENKKIRKVLKAICIKIYNSFDNLLIASKGYRDIFINYNINEEKIKYFPQWGEDIFNKDIEENKLNNKFKVTFAGNIGKAQGVDVVIEAAKLAKAEENIEWIILGDGSEFSNIKTLVDNYELSETVKLLGRKPVTDMPKYFAESDVMLVTLKDDFILNNTVPAKVQAYMAAGKPIIASANGEAAVVIEESKCGKATKAEDAKDLYKAVLELYKLDKEKLVLMGNKGFNYYKENFTKNMLMRELVKIMELGDEINV